MEKMNRRGFLQWLGSAVTAAAIPLNEIEAEKPQHKHIDYSKIPVPRVGYHPNNNEIIFGANLADMDGSMGRIQRALRWSNITQAVGNRYGMPHRNLLGMICVESEGDPTQPNELGDGGAGLIHMQPLLANAYGLKMITNSKRLRDFSQGKKLKRAIEHHGGDLKDLIKLDQRFHPIINVDAAARMLCDHYERSHSWNKALERYAGRSEYDARVSDCANKIGNKKYMQKVREDFLERNEGMKVNRKQFTFDDYISGFHRVNRNYGLEEYVKLKKYPVK